MFVNNRIILEEENVESFLERVKLEVKDFLSNDSRFAIYEFEVETEIYWECFNPDNDCMWHDIEIRVKNTFLDSFTCISYTTDGIRPQLVFIDGEPKFYYVFEWGSSSITDSVTFQNKDGNGRFENILESEVFNKIKQ